MKNMYHSKPAGIFLRIFSMILVFSMVFEGVYAARETELPEMVDYEFTIAENTAAGTVIGELSVSNAEIFSIRDGNEEGFFKIDEVTGELTVSEDARFDYETKSTFTLTVVVSNDLGTSEVVLTIYLANVAGPEAVTGGVSDITAEGAVLHGTFNDNGASTVAAIQYGTSEALSDDFDPAAAEGAVEAEAGTGETSLQRALAGLQDGITYYYRTVAKSEEGVSFGETKSFTTFTIPEVSSITRMDPNPTKLTTLRFRVEFSESVTGVDVADFEISKSGSVTANFLSVVEESAAVYVVTLENVGGDGELTIHFEDNETVFSMNGIAIGGEGVTNGDFFGSEIYTIDNTPPILIEEWETLEDVPFVTTLNVSDDPNNADQVVASFRSENEEVIPSANGVFTGTGQRRTLTITPAPFAHGEAVVEIILTDQAGGETRRKYLMRVKAVANSPIVTAEDVEGEEDFPIELRLGVDLVDKDGSEVINDILLSGVPDGAQLSKGVYVSDGTYRLSEADLAGLTFTAPENRNFDLDGLYTLTFKAESKETEGNEDLVNKRFAQAEVNFTIRVVPLNDDPVFALDPSTLEVEEDFTETHIVNFIPDEVPEDEQDQSVSYSIKQVDMDQQPIANVELIVRNGVAILEITSIPDANGIIQYRLIAKDGEGGTHEEIFTLIVNPVNDGPEFELSEVEIVREEDFAEPVIITADGLSPEDEAEGVRYSLSPAPADVDFISISIEEGSGKITITSVPDMHGYGEFIVTADDGDETASRKFTVRVTPVNDEPEFTLDPSSLTLEEDFGGPVPVNIVPAPVPADEEGQPVSYTIEVKDGSAPIANVEVVEVDGAYQLHFTSIQDANGTQTFLVTATEDIDAAEPNSTYTQDFVLIISPVNDAPVLVGGGLADHVINEDELWEYTIPEGIFTDPDGDGTLTFSASLLDGEELPAWLSFDASTQTFSGTPDGPDVGDYQILVIATDDDGQEIRDDFTLTVVPVNDPPVISEIDDVTIDLGDAVPPVNFTVSDEETPANELVVTVTSDNDALLPVSAFRLSGEGENRVLELMPPFEEWGSAIVTVTVSDGEAEAQEQFTFTVSFQELALDIPDLITPNGDGANDTWNIRYLSLYENNEIRVFDRTGKLVFQARNYSREWEGTHNGRLLPEGVYYYEIKLNSGTNTRRGTITIAR